VARGSFSVPALFWTSLSSLTHDQSAQGASSPWSVVGHWTPVLKLESMTGAPLLYDVLLRRTSANTQMSVDETADQRKKRQKYFSFKFFGSAV